MNEYLIKVTIKRKIKAVDKEQALTKFSEMVEDYNSMGISGCDIINDNLEIDLMSVRRVAVCEHTKKKVIQEWIGTEWLCLHNDNELLDEKEVKRFETEQNKK